MTHGWMLDFFNRLRQFNPRVNNAVAMLEKRRQDAEANVAVLVDGGADDCTAAQQSRRFTVQWVRWIV